MNSRTDGLLDPMADRGRHRGEDVLPGEAGEKAQADAATVVRLP